MSATARNQVFSAVHTIGGLLPADMLVRISEGKDVSGSGPADYRVVGARSVPDDAERHWDYLKSIWLELRQKLPVAAEAQAPADPTALAVRDWLEPLFNALGFGRLTAVGAAGISTDDGSKTFPISHSWQHVPIHLVGWNAKLDTRSAPGAVPPQSLVQECLNRTDNHLWAVLANGRQLRLLRDSSALATASYVEFDLEAIFDGELFSEFVLLYRLLHVSRFEVAEGATPSSCWLEKWRLEAITSGTRALDHLRDGVQQAITTLGTGFLRHPANSRLREGFDAQAFHNALLRLAYRMLFLFVIEDRDVLHPPGTDQQARERYIKYFSTARLRLQARRRRGTTHSDLYQALTYVVDALGDEQGRPELGLPGLGGIFTGKAGKPADEPLRGFALQNEYLLTAVRHLAQVRDPGSRRWRSVDYRNLGAEELGSIYESLLELVPRHRPEDRSFTLETLAGNTRKTTGSYYTPSSLIECLLDSTLDPVIDDAVKRGEHAASTADEPDPTGAIVNELLGLRVCDPACGSGHFLVAAARRIAKRVAAVRERNPEPTIDAVSHSMHEVIAQCIYGVDLNPMAVELAKVSLWLEGMKAGKALSFLDAHLKCGNALIGATPALLKKGIPSAAFKPIEGDDKRYAKGLERQNTEQQASQGSFFDLIGEPAITNSSFAARLARITDAPADKLDQVRDQENAYQQWTHDEDYRQAQHLADAWCAAFAWHKTEDSPPAVTQDIFRSLANPLASVGQRTHEEIVRLREQYAFFHWHLEFPDVFAIPEDSADAGDPANGWTGGFNCILGNPPWERVKLQEQEFFATRHQGIAGATNKAHRDRLLNALANSAVEAERRLHDDFLDARRASEGVSHLLRDSGRFPLAGRGDVNTYAVFAEAASLAIASHGRFGLVLPTGIATDATTAPFFSDLVRTGRLAAFLDFENEAFLLSRDVHHSVRFALLTVTGRDERVDRASFAFGTRHIEDLDARRFAMPPDEILLVNPNTGTLPVFRSRRDAEITIDIYRRVPPFIREGNASGNPWGISLRRMFHMADDAHIFQSRETLEADHWQPIGNIFERDFNRMLPLFEAKMLHHYDHRFGTYDGQTDAQARMGTLPRPTSEQHNNAEFVSMPRYWVPEFDIPSGRRGSKGQIIYELGVASQLAAQGWNKNWLMCWRDIARSTDARTMVSTILPLCGVGHTSPAIFAADAVDASLLQALFSSFVVDYVIRQKMAGTHLTYSYLQQTPIPDRSLVRQHSPFLTPRVVELIYTSHDLTAFTKDAAIFPDSLPFRWQDGRRAQIRAEIDSYILHMYEITRESAAYILETFPIVRRADEAKYGSYQTKELVLAEYDRMAAAGLSLTQPLVDGENYTSTLNPPPGQGPRHPAR
jgi:hypothetical protein